jgi:hypothetical protein
MPGKHRAIWCNRHLWFGQGDAVQDGRLVAALVTVIFQHCLWLCELLLHLVAQATLICSLGLTMALHLENPA